MTIHIKSNDGPRIKLWFPTSLLKSKFIIQKISKNIDTDIKPLIDSLPKFYKTLQKYIKTNGHFTLVDIRIADGNMVIVKV